MARQIHAGFASLRSWSVGIALCALGIGGCRVFDPALLPPTAAGAVAPGSRDASVDARLPEPVDGAEPVDAGSSVALPESGAGGAAAGVGASGGGVSGAGPAGAGASGANVAGMGAAGSGPTMPGCMPTALDFCTHVPALAMAPVIDGELDCGPALLPLSPVGWNGASALPADHHASFAVAWRTTGLYVYVKVVDPTLVPHPADAIQCGDAVEVYVDSDGVVDATGKYAKPGTMQFVVAAPSASAPGTIEARQFVDGVDQGAWSQAAVKTAVLPDGYAVELFIGAADLGLTAWSPSMRVGLDVALDVSGTSNLRCGAQAGQYFLQRGAAVGGCSSMEPWCDSRAFCVAALDAAL